MLRGQGRERHGDEALPSPAGKLGASTSLGATSKAPRTRATPTAAASCARCATVRIPGYARRVPPVLPARAAPHDAGTQSAGGGAPLVLQHPPDVPAFALPVSLPVLEARCSTDREFVSTRSTKRTVHDRSPSVSGPAVANRCSRKKTDQVNRHYHRTLNAWHDRAIRPAGANPCGGRSSSAQLCGAGRSCAPPPEHARAVRDRSSSSAYAPWPRLRSCWGPTDVAFTLWDGRSAIALPPPSAVTGRRNHRSPPQLVFGIAA